MLRRYYRNMPSTVLGFRKSVYDVHIRFRSLEDPTRDRDQQFLAYLEQAYLEDKDNLDELLAHGNLDSRPGMLRDKIAQGMSISKAILLTRQGLFMVAVGLVCYGRLDVIEDILDNLPPAHNRLALLARVLSLLHLPESVDPLTDPAAAKVWFQKNIQKIQWDEATAEYRLKA